MFVHFGVLREGPDTPNWETRFHEQPAIAKPKNSTQKEMDIHLIFNAKAMQGTDSYDCGLWCFERERICCRFQETSG